MSASAREVTGESEQDVGLQELGQVGKLDSRKKQNQNKLPFLASSLQCGGGVQLTFDIWAGIKLKASRGFALRTNALTSVPVTEPSERRLNAFVKECI